MGHDKAFITVGGVPLWQRQIALLQELGSEEILISGPEHAAWRETEFAIIADAERGAGPLAGVVAALRVCESPMLLALAVDLPLMTSNYLRQLLTQCADGTGAVPIADERFEPLAAVYPAGALPIAEDCLASGRRSLQHFARRCVAAGLVVARPVASAERMLFSNMNTPADIPA